MITSPDNAQLKLIRKLQRKKERDESGLFAAEGEDLVEAAEAAGWAAEVLLRSGEDVEPDAARPGELARLGQPGDRRLPPALVGAAAATCRSTCTAWATRATWARSSAPRTRWPTGR